MDIPIIPEPHVELPPLPEKLRVFPEGSRLAEAAINATFAFAAGTDLEPPPHLFYPLDLQPSEAAVYEDRMADVPWEWKTRQMAKLRLYLEFYEKRGRGMMTYGHDPLKYNEHRIFNDSWTAIVAELPPSVIGDRKREDIVRDYSEASMKLLREKSRGKGPIYSRKAPRPPKPMVYWGKQRVAKKWDLGPSGLL